MLWRLILSKLEFISYFNMSGKDLDDMTFEKCFGKFHPHSGRRVVFLSKRNLLPKSTGNTQEEMASFQHD